MNARSILMVVLPFLVVAAGAAGAAFLVFGRGDVETRQPERALPLVRVETVARGAVQLTVRSQGSVRPRTEGTVVPQVSGVIATVSPSWVDGGFFEAGEILLRIDRRDYELALVRARAQVAQAELRLALEKEEADVARKEWEQLGKTKKPSVLLLREPQLADARAALAAARAVKEQAELDLERTTLRAPYAGRVWQKMVDVGQYVARGTALARIYAVDEVEIRLPVPDVEIAYLDLPLDYRGDPERPRGPEVLLKGRFAGKEHTWKGRVTRTEAEIDPQSRMVHVIAAVKDPYGRGEDPATSTRPPLAIGLFVEAEIRGRRLEDVVVLPRHVLRRPPEWNRKRDPVPPGMAVPDEDGSSKRTEQVLVVDEQSRLRFRPVEVLRLSEAQVVIGKGLEDHDKVCLSFLDVIVEGMKVTVVEAAE